MSYKETCWVVWRSRLNPEYRFCRTVSSVLKEMIGLCADGAMRREQKSPWIGASGEQRERKERRSFLDVVMS